MPPNTVTTGLSLTLSGKTARSTFESMTTVRALATTRPAACWNAVCAPIPRVKDKGWDFPSPLKSSIRTTVTLHLPKAIWAAGASLSAFPIAEYGNRHHETRIDRILQLGI